MVRGRSGGMRRSLATKRVERGLYSGFARGIQKLQKRADAGGPGRLVSLGAFDALVVQVALELPALCEEDVAEFLDLRNDARTFTRADIQPNARPGFDDRSAREAENHLLVPPDGRRERGDFSKDARMLQPQIEGDEAAERGT